MSSLSNTITLTVSRETIVSDLITAYLEDAQLPLKTVKFSFKHEEGTDEGGLTREVFTVFWDKINGLYLVGEDVLVPFMPLYRQRKEQNHFIAIGRILSHMAALTGTIPARLALSCYICTIFDSDVHELTLVQDFELFVTANERLLVKKALVSFESLDTEEKDRLQALVSAFGLYELLSPTEVRQQLVSVAREVLVDRSRRFYQLMRQGMPQQHRQLFWSELTIDHLLQMMVSQQATSEKVANCITAVGDVSNAQEKILYYLQVSICCK
jgi:hypothetical protein